MIALDLFCGGGGTALGLFQAGFTTVVGIDTYKPRDYPGDFIQADALKPPVKISNFDFIWASPPCQLFTYSTCSRGNTRKKHPNLIPQTQEILAGHPFTCIENVPQAPIRRDLILTGPCVGLHLIKRQRAFETSFFILAPPPASKNHGNALTITKSLASSNHYYRRIAEGKPGKLPVAEAKIAMGIPESSKMTGNEIGEAVPPPYAEYIGKHVISLIQNA